MSQPPHDRSLSYVPPTRIECLDSIRGLAALAVLISHVTMAFYWSKDVIRLRDMPVLNMMYDGRSAVTMFFVLSGFVLTLPYLANPSRGRRARELFIPTFYLRRVTRIWIPWAFAFLASVVAKTYFWKHFATTPDTSAWFNRFWLAPVTLTNAIAYLPFSIHDSKMVPQDWSLVVEILGSAMIPVFLFFIGRFRPALAVAAVLFLIFDKTGQYYVSFILGAVAALWYCKHDMWLHGLQLKHKVAMLLSGIALYQIRLIAEHYFRLTDNLDKGIWCAASVGCIMILAAVLGSRRIQTVLGFPAITFLGKISYSIYLIQYLVVLCVLPLVIHSLNATGITSQILLHLATVLIAIAGTVVLAVPMYYTVEIWSIELGRLLTRFVQSYFGTERHAASAVCLPPDAS